jgi:hypothetical protein
MTITGTRTMVLVGVAGMEAVGECITIPGCIPVGVIMTLGIPVIMVMVTEVGMILGGVITASDTVDITDTAVTTVTVVVGMVAEAMVTLGAMHFQETNIHCPTINVISFPM